MNIIACHKILTICVSCAIFSLRGKSPLSSFILVLFFVCLFFISWPQFDTVDLAQPLSCWSVYFNLWDYFLKEIWICFILVEFLNIFCFGKKTFSFFFFQNEAHVLWSKCGIGGSGGVTFVCVSWCLHLNEKDVNELVPGLV